MSKDLIIKYYRLNYDDGLKFMDINPMSLKQRIFDEFSSSIESVISELYNDLSENRMDLDYESRAFHNIIPQFNASIVNTKDH